MISDNSDISKPCGGILTYSFLCLIYAIYGIPAAVSLLSIAVRSLRSPSSSMNFRSFLKIGSIFTLEKSTFSVQCCKALHPLDSVQISLLFSLFSLHLYVHISYTAPPFCMKKLTLKPILDSMVEWGTPIKKCRKMHFSD